MIIDGHHHIEDDYEPILRSMDALGIDMTVLVGVGVSDLGVVTIKDSPVFRSHFLLKTFGPMKARRIVKSKWFNEVILEKPRNDAVLRAMEEKPDRFAGFAFVNPARPEVLADIETCLDRGMKGIKFALLQFPEDMGGPRMKAICELARDRDVPIFVHPGITSESANMEPMIRAFPKNKFIIAHAGVQFFRETIEFAKKYEKVFVDTSSYIVTKRKLEILHRELGPEKIIFGSDVPVMAKDQKSAMEKITNLKIPDSHKEMILGENLRNLLGL